MTKKIKMTNKIKNSVSGEATVTATTTAKQERYEKKMAKYAANKARREQMENEKAANRKKNETRKVGFDPSRLMYGHLTGIDKMYIGKSYTMGEVLSFQMGYNENNCPTSARTGSKDWVYAGSGIYVTVEEAKSMGINIR